MDGALYCEKDYEQRFAPTCAKCVKAIKEVLQKPCPMQ